LFAAALMSLAPASAASGGSGPAATVSQVPGSGYGPSDKVVALTFDDGPDPTYTPQILAALARANAPATFFEIGREVAAYPAVTGQVASAGDPVEDHTWDHVDLTHLPASSWPAEVDRTSAAITSITGRAVTCLRPPYDAVDPSVVSLAATRGLSTVIYSTDTDDWRRPGVTRIVANALAGLHNGSIVLFHDGGGDRSETVAALPEVIAQIRARGYRLVHLCTPRPYLQQAVAFGDAGPLAPPAPSSSQPVGATATLGDGLWTVAANGGVSPYGDARSFGSAAGLTLAAPVVGMAATPDGGGYWLVAADGGIFSFGDARFAGSAGGLTLAAPVVGMAATPDGGGYWLVAADGGIFSFGDARFAGSAGGLTLAAPVVGMAATPDGGGYWLVAADGRVLPYGDGAPGFAGTWPAITAFALVPVRSGRGYWLVGDRLGDS